MRTGEVAETWVDEMMKKHSAKCKDYSDINLRGNNVSGRENIFYSYAAPICVFDGVTFIVSKQKYSTTTQKHQSYLRRALPTIEECQEEGVCVEYVESLEGDENE